MESMTAIVLAVLSSFVFRLSPFAFRHIFKQRFLPVRLDFQFHQHHAALCVLVFTT
jgi:hypothetical protein